MFYEISVKALILYKVCVDRVLLNRVILSKTTRGKDVCLIPFTDQAQNARSVSFELLLCGLVCKGYYTPFRPAEVMRLEPLQTASCVVLSTYYRRNSVCQSTNKSTNPGCYSSNLN